MLRSYTRIVGLLLIVSLIGCGGGSSAPAPSRFAGTWSGPWTDNQGQSGTLTVTVGTTGTVTGSIINKTLGANGVANGVIGDAGNLNATFAYPVGVSGTATVDGTVSVGTNGQLNGVLQEAVNNVPYGAVTLDLTRQ